MIIGITGSIGCGKSTVAKIFSRHHFKIIDADKAGNEILEKSIVQRKLISAFGRQILGRYSKVGRKKLRDVAFSDEKNLKKLNSIMHPEILKAIKKRITKIRKECGRNYRIIIDAPLLYETGAEKFVDKVIVVKCGPEKMIERSKKFNAGDVKRIAEFQMPLNTKLRKADFAIDNNFSFRNTELQVAKILKALDL